MEIPAGLTQSAFSELIGCRVQRLEEGVAEVALSLEPQLRNRAGNWAQQAEVLGYVV